MCLLANPMNPTRSLLSLAVVWLAAVGSLCAISAAAQAAQPAACQAHCPDRQGLPLEQWSEDRSAAEVYTFPWGAQYAFQPLDYAELSKEVCACLEQASGAMPGLPCWFEHEGKTS